jgi:hypothetical protein
MNELNKRVDCKGSDILSSGTSSSDSSSDSSPHSSLSESSFDTGSSDSSSSESDSSSHSDRDDPPVKLTLPDTEKAPSALNGKQHLEPQRQEGVIYKCRSGRERERFCPGEQWMASNGLILEREVRILQ